MVSSVRVRVPPLSFSRYFQGKPSTLPQLLRVERCFYHNRYHNGHSLEVPREEIVEAHGGLAVHGGGDVRVGVGGSLYGGVSEHAEARFSCSLFSNMSVAKVYLRS